MSALSDLTVFEQEEESVEIKELQRAVNKAKQKLGEMRRERLCVEEETARCKRENELKLALMMENGEILDALHELGNLLQEEKHLSEWLDQEAASHRNQMSILEEQMKSASSTVQSLAAEIQQVKEHLAKPKACGGAAQASIIVPASKAKRKPRKK